jgi:hypothetical protein
MKKWKKQLFPLTCQFEKRTLLFPFFRFLLDEISSSVHQRECKTDVKSFRNRSVNWRSLEISLTLKWEGNYAYL